MTMTLAKLAKAVEQRKARAGEVNKKRRARYRLATRLRFTGVEALALRDQTEEQIYRLANERDRK